MRIHSLSGQSTHLGDGSASPVPPAGARRPEEESSPRSYRQPRGIAGDKLAPMRGPGMGGMRGSIADTIASARASLKNPSRPFTPADPMRRLSAHSLLPRADYGVAPPTPLIETSNFEGERPFTQHRRKTPLPAPGGLGAPAGVLGPLGGVSSLAGVGQRQADILSLEDDDACDVGPQGPTQHSSLRSGRRENVLRKEKGSRDNTSLTRGGRASSADDSASAVWNALEAQLPVLVKKGRESGSGSGGEAMRVMAACDSILSQVTDLDTVQALTTEERTAVVKAAASCLEMKEPVELMAKVGKVILAVTKGGANLLAVAKLLFRLSKNSANDETLRSEGVGEAVLAAVAAGGRLESVLGHIARLSEQCEQEVEAVMLLFAVLKNMSTDSDEVRRSLMRHSVLSTVTAWVRALVRERRSHMGGSVWGTRATDSSAGGESGALGVGGGVRRMNVELHVRSVLSQSLALMRNLAVLSAQRDEFVACGTIRGVVEVISLWGEDQELLLNASRLLSKVSMTPSCQDEMAAIEPAVHSVLLGVLERERDKLPLVVRVLFVLGSLTASEEEHRIKMLAHEGAVDLLLSLLVTHVDAILHSTSAQCAPHAGAGAGTSSSSSSSSPCGAADAGEDAGGGAAVAVTNHPSQDTLVKLVRLLAHLAISPEVGPEMAKSSKVEAVLRLLEHVPMHASEELILNTVSLVTNLTYYTLSESVLWARRLELLPLLAEMLFVENQEAVLEAARAFGNLSRCPQVRKKMKDTRIDEALVLLLDHSEAQVLAAAAGVVVNLSGDQECGMSEVLQTDALVMLLESLARPGTEVEQICTVCYAIFNLCASLDWQLDGLIAAQLVQALEDLIGELNIAMNERDQQMDSALLSVAQRLVRAVKTRCAQAMTAAAPEIEAMRLEEEAVYLRHGMASADEDGREEMDGVHEGDRVREATMESMLEPLEGAEEHLP